MKFHRLFNVFLSLAFATGLLSNIGLAQTERKEPDQAFRMQLVPIENGSVALTPKNTKIEFIGTHVADDPQPRLGGFERFEGEIRLDGRSIKSIVVEIDTTSIWTQFPKLTAHLLTGDFFNAKEFPASKFESTEISQSAAETTVTGKLTMMGVTNELEFPARVTMFDGGFGLTAEFKLDRTQWGMDKMTDRVNSEVTLRVVVGQKTNPQTGNQK